MINTKKKIKKALSSLLAVSMAVTSVISSNSLLAGAITGDDYSDIRTSCTTNAADVVKSVENDEIDSSYTFNLTMGQNTVATIDDSSKAKLYTFGSEYNYLKANGATQVFPANNDCKGVSATYKNVGTYNNKVVNVRLTVTDYEARTKNMGANVMSCFVFPVASVRTDNTSYMGVSCAYMNWVKIKYDFFDNNGNALNIKGFTTWNDIDGRQGVQLVSNFEDQYVVNKTDCLLNCAKEATDGKYFYCNSGLSSENEDITNWLTTTFSGTSVTALYTFNNNKDDSDPNGNGWIVNYAGKAVASEVPYPIKTVSDNDEKNAITNTLYSRDEMFEYYISQTVPEESPEHYYTSFEIKDTIPASLNVVGEAANVYDSNGNDVTDKFSIEYKNGVLSAKAAFPNTASFYNKTYTLNFMCQIKDTVDISSQNFFITNSGEVDVNRNGLTTNISAPVSTYTTLTLPSIKKYIDTTGNETKPLHKNSEDVTYVGTFNGGNAVLYSTFGIEDTLENGLAYKSLTIYDGNEDITNYGDNTSNAQSVKFMFSSEKMSKVFDKTLSYKLVVTATKTYDGTATADEKTPNKIKVLVNNTSVDSNIPYLYRSGVNIPTKSVDKSVIQSKTEDLIYTISNKVDEKTKNYYYDSYGLSDKFDKVLNIQNAKITDKAGNDVTSLFDVTTDTDNNTVTATAKDTSIADFYNTTYNLIVKANIKQNADLTNYIDGEGNAIVKNIGILTVDGNNYMTNEVATKYIPKENKIDKYILKTDNTTVEKDQLYDNVATFIGTATIQDKVTTNSISLSDKLDSNLKYVDMTVYLNDKDITNYGDIVYDEDSNNLSFTVKEDKVSELSGKDIVYKIDTQYIGKYTSEVQTIPNTIDLNVNDVVLTSNEVNLTTPVDSYITKHIVSGSELVDELTLSEDRENNLVAFSGTIFISEKEPLSTFEFTDKLDSNLKYVSISFTDADGKEITSTSSLSEADNTITSTIEEDNLKHLLGKTITYTISTEYVGEKAPIANVEIPNTASVKLNNDVYTSNTVKVIVAMVSTYEATTTTAKSTTTQKTTQEEIAPKEPTSEDQTDDNTTLADTAETSEAGTPANTGSNITFLLMAGCLVVLSAITVISLLKKKNNENKN